MRTRAIGLLFLAFALAGRADAICVGPKDPAPPLRGTVADCRSALPELEAALEKHREAFEESRESFRNLPNFDSLWIFRPYDEQIAHRLSRVQGVIVTFRTEGAEPAELFLEVGGSSCDLIAEPAPTQLVLDPACCDVTPPSDDSCMLGLTRARLR